MSKLLTLKEIAGVLGVPESSLRKYREFFEAFIPSVGKGRSRRYRTEAIEIFKDIRHLREDMQMPWDAITDKLAERWPIDATPAAQHEPEPVAAAQVYTPPPRPEPAAPPAARETPAPAPPRPAPEPARVTPLPGEPADALAVTRGSAYLKKIVAISEKQMMTVNAMAMELVQAVEGIRNETRVESERMQRQIIETVNAMSRNMREVSTEEKKIMVDVQARIQDVRETMSRLEKSGDRTTKFVELEAQLKTVQRKLEQREKLIQEYKNSFEVLKRENTELRAFKARHVDFAEEKIRENKGLKKTPFINKVFGPKV